MAAVRRYHGQIRFVDEGLNSRDDSPIVMYRALHPSEHALFSRPRAEFSGRARLPDMRRTCASRGTPARSSG